MSKRRPELSTILIEMSSIIIAVLFAFTMENWRDDWKNEALAEKALVDILDELNDNKQMILNQDSAFVAFIQIGNKSLLSKKPDTLNLNYSLHTYETSSWATAQISQAVNNMSFDQVKSLKKSYFLIEFAQKLSNNIVQILVSPDFHDPARQLASRKALMLNAQSLNATNDSLVKKLDEVIRKYKQPN
jgi:hypothetical protein